MKGCETMTEEEWRYILKRLKKTHADHEAYQRMHKRETGNRWKPEIRIVPDTGIVVHLQRDEDG